MLTLQERVHSVFPPSAWSLNKLHRIFRVRKGYKNVGMQEENLLSLSYGKIIRKSIDTTEGLIPESFETYQIVEPNNIVMRLTDLQNDKRSLRQGLVKEKGIITSAYDALEVAKDHDARFWAYALLALDLAKYYYSLGGGVRQSIKFSDFPNDWVAAPDSKTQKQIADFLDRETVRINLLIEKKQRLVALVTEKRQTAISSEFTHLIDVPAKKLRHLLAEPLKYGANESANNDGTGSVRFVRITDLNPDGSLRDETIKTLPEDIAAPYMLSDGDVLFARSGATVGKSFLYKAHHGACCFAGYLIRARLRKNLIVPEFLKRYTETHSYWHFIALSNIQATIQNVSAEKYANITIPVPDIFSQKTILQKISSIEMPLNKIIQHVNYSIERLIELRASLITAAVTGQLDITIWQKRGQTERHLEHLETKMVG